MIKNLKKKKYFYNHPTFIAKQCLSRNEESRSTLSRDLIKPYSPVYTKQKNSSPEERHPIPIIQSAIIQRI